MRRDLTTNRNSTPNSWNRQEFDDFIERAFRHPLSFLSEFGNSQMSESGWFQPSIDVEESEQAYLLSVDLPGMKQEDVKVDLSENILTISGERKREDERKGKEGVRHFERSYGQFQRSFTLPSNVDSEKVEANMEDGVLRIALPKSESARARSIQVQQGKGGMFAKTISGEKDEESKKQPH